MSEMRQLLNSKSSMRCWSRFIRAIRETLKSTQIIMIRQGTPFSFSGTTPTCAKYPPTPLCSVRHTQTSGLLTLKREEKKTLRFEHGEKFRYLTREGPCTLIVHAGIPMPQPLK